MHTNFISGETDVDTSSITLDELSNQFKIINSGEKRIAIIGTRNLPITHQQVVEYFAHALTLGRNTIVTSGGGSGVNLAAIKGALKSAPELLEVILPQTIEQQPSEVREILKDVGYIVEHPERVNFDLSEAGRVCYHEIVGSVHQVIVFMYHDSNVLQETVDYAKTLNKIVTELYLD